MRCTNTQAFNCDVFSLLTDDDSVSATNSAHGGNQNTEATDKLPNANLHYSQLLNSDASAISSVETLLMNIQGLLKVAAENARHRERQINYEKGIFLFCIVLEVNH